MNLCRFCESPEHSGGCDREQLKRVIGNLREEVRVKTLELQATKKLEGENVVMVTSLISHRTEKTRIDIQVGEIHTQMSVDAAMDVAKNIIEVAQGSYADGFIFHYLREKLNQPVEIAAQLIQDFRSYREELKQEFDKDQKRDK